LTLCLLPSKKLLSHYEFVVSARLPPANRMPSKNGLQRVAKQFPTLARECQLAIAREFKQFMLEELQRQHHTGRSIYNDVYPKPKKGNQPMFDTGELSQGYEVRITPGGKTVARNVSVHTVVNADGKHTHLPDSRGMPERWQKRLEIIQRKHLKALLKRLKEISG